MKSSMANRNNRNETAGTPDMLWSISPRPAADGSIATSTEIMRMGGKVKDRSMQHKSLRLRQDPRFKEIKDSDRQHVATLTAGGSNAKSARFLPSAVRKTTEL